MTCFWPTVLALFLIISAQVARVFPKNSRLNRCGVVATFLPLLCFGEHAGVAVPVLEVDYMEVTV